METVHLGNWGWDLQRLSLTGDIWFFSSPHTKFGSFLSILCHWTREPPVPAAYQHSKCVYVLWRHNEWLATVKRQEKKGLKNIMENGCKSKLHCCPVKWMGKPGDSIHTDFSILQNYVCVQSHLHKKEQVEYTFWLTIETTSNILSLEIREKTRTSVCVCKHPDWCDALLNWTSAYFSYHKWCVSSYATRFYIVSNPSSNYKAKNDF